MQASFTFFSNQAGHNASSYEEYNLDITNKIFRLTRILRISKRSSGQKEINKDTNSFERPNLSIMTADAIDVTNLYHV